MAVDPIKIVSQNFFPVDALSSAPSTSFLLGNVGDKIRVETVFSIQNEVINSTDEPFIVNNTNGYLEDGWMTDDSYRFGNFKIGDQITYYNHVAGILYGIFTIIDKRSDGEIRLSPKPTGAGLGDNTTDTDSVISNNTAISSIKYSAAFVENASANTFVSPIDASEMIWAIPVKLASDTVVNFMAALGALTWQESLVQNQGVSIQGVSIVTTPAYVSTYKIIHYTKIPPYITYDQLENQLDGIADNDFLRTKCWKYIFKIDASETFTNPNFLVSQTFSDQLGNTGWYNENLNTGKTNYSISNIVYRNNGQVIDSLQFDGTENMLTFDVINTTDSPFTISGNTFSIGFLKVPADPIEYQNNNLLADINFLYDSAKTTVGGLAATGLNNSTGYKIIDSISAVFISSSKITVTLGIKLSLNSLAIFNESSIARYLIYFSIKNPSKTISDPLNDQVTLQVDLNEFTYVTADPGMIVFDNNVFLQHPDNDPTTQGINTTQPQPPYADAVQDININSLASETVAIFFPRLVSDVGYGGVIGIASWQGSLSATITKLILSINTNTAQGSFFGMFDHMDGPGFSATATAGVGASFDIVITSPSGSQSFYNGKFTEPGQPSGYQDYSVSVFFGGMDGFKLQFSVLPEDEIVASTDFYIESSTRLSDEIRLTYIDAKVVVSNGTNEFDLDKFTVQLSGTNVVGYTQQFDNAITRPFHIPDTEPRKVFEVKRRNDLDTGTRKYFSVQYPFMFRWETWAALSGVDAFFFNPTLPNNGFNHWWFRYYGGGWLIKLKYIVNATKNGIAQQYYFENVIVPYNYASNPRFNLKKIETFDPDTMLSLTSGSDNHINGFKKTLVVATFNVTDSITSATVEIGMEIFQKGSPSTKRSYSSRWDRSSDTWFESIDGSNLVQFTIVGTTVTAQCLIDNTKLPTNIQEVSLTARIWEYDTTSNTLLLTDTPDPILTNDSINTLVD